MRWGLLAVRASIWAVYLVVAAFVLLSVAPLAAGELKVDAPDTDEPGSLEWTYADRAATAFIPLDIHNGGYFDIQNLVVHLKLSDGGTVLAESSTPSTDIAAGREAHFNVSMTVDLGSLDQAEIQKLVFDRTTLDLDVEAEAGYVLGLASASIQTSQTLAWEPLVNEMPFDGAGAPHQEEGT